MAAKTYRLKVRKIPLPDDVVYKRPAFPAFKELHLDLLENKVKLKKNPPKPMFVYNDPPPKARDSPSHDYKDYDKNGDDDEDFTLEELERAYRDADSDDEDPFDDRDDESHSHHTHDRHEDESEYPSGTHEYRQQDFDQQQEEEEDEEEREKREKDELLFKFMVLRRQYPAVEIPEFTEHSDMTTMRRVYDQVIRRVSLDSSVDNYKQYLVGGFMVLEWVSTNWLGIDLSGFCQQQSRMMNKYDRLLIELGEKNYSTAGSRFPVEIRLLFLIIFNAGLFYVQKMIFSGGGGGGGGGGNIMNAFFGGAQEQAPAPQPVKRRRAPMRGPTISPQEVEELTRQSQMEDDDADDESDF